MRNLIFQLKFDSALEKIEELKETQKDVYFLIKSLIEIVQGNHDLALKYLNEAEENNRQTNSLTTLAVIFLERGHIHQYQGNYKISEEYFDKSLKMLENDSNDEIFDKEYWKVDLLRLQGTHYQMQGLGETALELINKSLELAEKIGDKIQLSSCYNTLGLYYRFQGDFEKCKENLEHSLKYAEGADASYSIGFPMYNLASVYLERFDYKKARPYLDKIAPLMEQLDNPLMLSQLNTNYALIDFQLGNMNRANEHLQIAFKYAGKAKSVFWASRTLILSIKIALYENQLETAKQNYHSLKNLRKDSLQDELLKNRTKYAKAMILKHSQRISQMGEALNLFKEISESNITFHDLIIDALIGQCEILLFELRATNNADVLHEIEEITSKILEIAEVKQIKAVTIEFLALKAKLAMLQGDFVKSENLIETCIANASEAGYKIMVERMEELKNSFHQEFQKLHNLIENNSPMHEKLEKLKVSSYIQFIKKMNTV